MFFSIALIRLVSILFLVIYHAYEPSFSLLVVFVDIFFFISVFLLFNKYFNNSNITLQIAFNNFTSILLKRIWLFSSTTLVVLTPIFIVIVLFFPLPYSSITSYSYSLFLVKNVQLIRANQDYFNSANIDYFKHLWYLSVDIQLVIASSIFFLLFAIIQNRLFYLITLITSFVSLFILSSFLLSSNFVEYYYNPVIRLWIIPFAGLLAYQQNQEFKSKHFFVLQSLYLFILLPYCLIYHFDYSLISLLSLSSVATLIFFEKRTSSNSSKFKSNSFIHYVISISKYVFFIYLIHYPLILLFKTFSTPSLPYNKFYLLVFLLIAILISAFFYHFIAIKNLSLRLLALSSVGLSIVSLFIFPQLSTLRSRISPIIPSLTDSQLPLYLPTLPSSCLNSNTSLIICLNGKRVPEASYRNYSSIGIGDSFSLDLPYYFNRIYHQEEGFPTLSGFDLFIHSSNTTNSSAYPLKLLSLFPNLRKVYFIFSPTRFLDPTQSYLLGTSSQNFQDAFLANLKKHVQFFIDSNIEVIFIQGHPLGCNTFQFNNSVITSRPNTCFRYSDSHKNLTSFLERNFRGRVKLETYAGSNIDQFSRDCPLPSRPMIFDSTGHLLPAAYPFLRCLYSK